MERAEPVLVPQWYKAANGGASSSANLNQNAGLFTHLEDHGSSSNHDAPKGLSLSRGSSSSNGSLMREKDLHPYSSFGRSRRDRERDAELRGRDRGRDRPSFGDDRFRDRSDSFKASSKDRMRRSHSMVSGRQMESFTKRPGNEMRNGVIGGIGKSSFERDFPSLGAEEKQRLPDRIMSPRIPIGSLAVIGPEGWSALADVSALQAPSPMTGLNMAEALVQAPSRVRTPPEVVDTQKIEELTLRQCKQLIPVTPLMTKTLVTNPSERSKSKGARSELSGHPKAGQQASSQLLNHPLRAPRFDIQKASQPGNFQVLNREKSNTCPAAKDAQAVSRTVNPVSAVASATVPSLKSPLSAKLKSDIKGNALSSRPLGQAQNRNAFFNDLRKKTSMNHSSAETSSNLEKSGEQSSGVGHGNGAPATDSGFNCSVENGNGVVCEGPERFISGEGENRSCVEPVIDQGEEEAFLRSLGWEEDARVEALTPEEIDAFNKEFEKIKPTLKLPHRAFPSLSGCKAES